MPRVRGPLFSISASGVFRNEIEFRTVGTSTVAAGAKKVKPERSAGQQQQAARFAQAVAGWQATDQTTKDTWAAAAAGTGLTGYQLYISAYQTQGIVPPDQPVLP